MPRFDRIAAVLFAFLFAITLITPCHAAAQTREDSVTVTHVSSDPYVCCFNFIVYNGHADTSKRISEFRVDLVSGNARIIAGAGAAGSPIDWSVFIDGDLRGVSWFANTRDAELDSAESTGGFRICVRDTGVFRLAWTTRNIDSTLSTDTLTFVCTANDCDEAFFHQVPSSEECVFDIDLASNTRNRTINRFGLEIVTPNVEFRPEGGRVPSGWRRSNPDSNQILYTTTSSGLTFGQFVQGFRVRIDGSADSTFRLVYRTFEFDQQLCFDTVTLHCRGLDTFDFVSAVDTGGSCCHDLYFINRHVPGSTVDHIRLEVLTPEVTFSGPPTPPPGWMLVGSSSDTALFAAASSLASGDTAIIRGLCFDNSLASNDSIHFQIDVVGDDVRIERGTVGVSCQRPLVFCDSVTVDVDSTFPSPYRCITVNVSNTNSLGALIERVALHLSNPGTRRVILSSTPPAGFAVEASGPDSIVFSGGRIYPGETKGFELCLGLGDTTTGDPLTIRWATSTAAGALCSGSVEANLILDRTCDSVAWSEVTSASTDECCFEVRFLNRNDQSIAVQGLLFAVGRPDVIFSSAAAPDGWTLSTSDFPNAQIGFDGGPIASGGAQGGFSFCINTSQLPAARPVTIPVVWRSFGPDGAICFDTVRLVCSGEIEQRCDTMLLLGATTIAPNTVQAQFRLRNQALPAAPVDTVRFTIVGGTGQFFEASGPAGWNLLRLDDSTVVFGGGALLSGDSADFTIKATNVTDPPLVVTMSSVRADQTCSQTFNVNATSGVRQAGAAIGGLSLGAASPNPTTGRIEIPFTLKNSADVSIVICDAVGRRQRRLTLGRLESGAHSTSVDLSGLPSGVYLYTLEVRGRSITRRVVLAR